MQKAAPKVDIDVSYISKDLSYFFVFKDGPQEASLKNIKPTVLVYRDTDQQLSALIKRYY